MSSRFQSFDEGGDPAEGAARIAKLRAELTRRGLQGFVVPRADEHQSEYVPKNAERLAWLTGFTGSAGTAVILLEDGGARRRRALYPAGAGTGRHDRHRRRCRSPRPRSRPGSRPICPRAPASATTPGCTRPPPSRSWKRPPPMPAARLVPVDMNPVDVIWVDRPPPPSAPVRPHPVELAGESSEDKLARIREKLGKDKVGALVVSDPHNLAWTFNIRGGDVAHTPLPLGYAVIPAGRPPDRVPRSRQGDERGGRGARRCCRRRRAGGPRRRPRPPGQGQGQDPYR